MRVFDIKDFSPKKHYFLADERNILLLVERLNPQLEQPESRMLADHIQWAKNILNKQMHDFYWSGRYLNIDALDWNVLLNMSVIDIRAVNDELWVFVSYASLEDYAREYLV